MKKITAIITALALITIMAGCGKNDSRSESEISTSESDIVETSAAETKPPTDPEPEGLKLSNDVYGYSLDVPESLDTTDGSLIDGHEVISQTDYIMINSSESKDNLNVVVETSKSPDSFDKNTKESYKKQCDALGIFRNFAVNTFEKTKIAGYDAIYVETSAKNPDGEKFSQIQVIVNRTDEDAPYCYTFTYTDYSGTLTDEFRKSVESIEMTTPVKSAASADEHAGEPFTFDMFEGMELNLPDDWKITEGESDTPHVVTGDRAMFAPSALGDASNFLVTISESSDNEEDFLTYTQEDFEALLSGSYQDIKTVSFESLNVDGYDAFKYVCDITGEDTKDLNLRLTMLFINCPDRNAGIMLCLTDFNQNNKDTADKLETLIKFTK